MSFHIRRKLTHLPFYSPQNLFLHWWPRNKQAHNRCFSASSLPHLRAAAMIIGDEILNGNVSDTNTPWLAKLLFNQGVDFVRVEYIPDDKQEIIETVRRLKEKVGPSGAVFSSGGIGPTHDDITYESLAAAFGVGLAEDDDTVGLMRESYDKRGVELNASRLRMARLPTPSEGVYILPGIPRLFRQMVEAHKDRFRGPEAHAVHLLTNVGEGDLAEALTEIAAAHGSVAIGSYPQTEQAQGHSVKISLVSREQGALEAAAAAVRDRIDILL